LGGLKTWKARLVDKGGDPVSGLKLSFDVSKAELLLSLKAGRQVRCGENK